MNYLDIYILTFIISITTFIIALTIMKLISKDKLLIRGRIGRLASNNPTEVEVRQKRKKKHERSVDSKVKILKRLTNELLLSGVMMRSSEFLIVWALATLGPSSLFLLIRNDLIVSLAIAIVGLVLPPLFLHRKKVKRIQLFEMQLAEAVAIICNSLKAGLTFQQAINSIANEMPEPISKEFGRVIKEMKLGNSIEKALTNMSERLNSKDFMLMVSAILIQRQTGGNLSEILTNIAVTIKERFKIKSEIKVLTTTGRSSGMVVGAMPIIILLFFMIINPGYIRSFFETTIGIIILSVAAALEIIGFLIIKKIVNIKY